MNIKELGGEFALIKKVTKHILDKTVLTPIGDDCAVLAFSENEHLLFTTDMLVQDVHFNFQWFTFEQIGKKAMEVNVSDIFAKGGKPTYCVISLGLPSQIQVEAVQELYKGFYAVAVKYGFSIVGGDTNQSEKLIVTVAMLGVVKKEKLCLRSGAKAGDLLCVSRALGSAAVGFAILQQKKEKELALEFSVLKNYFLEPIADSSAVIIADSATAMIDISDGLASEIHHICSMSNVGALLETEKIPLLSETKKVATYFGKDAIDYALFGGEDFAVLFTVSPNKIHALKNFFVIGKIVPKNEGVVLFDGKQRRVLENKGYDHFL